MHAQYGEDDIVDELLGSPSFGIVVDIGAGDGMEISNSRLFRERGWHTRLVEVDTRHEAALFSLTGDVVVEMVPATPENISDLVPDDTTVLSIDVDGDDIFLLEVLAACPQVVIIEHNPTIPWNADVQPARLGLRVGASVAALMRVAREKGYGLAAVTHCNAIFQLGAPDIELPAYQSEYAVATEYFTGRPFVVGEAPWGTDFASPYPPEDVIVR
jgi:hypothetical protein